MKDMVIRFVDAIMWLIVGLITISFAAVGAFVEKGAIWFITAPFGAMMGLAIGSLIAASWFVLSGIYYNTKPRV